MIYFDIVMTLIENFILAYFVFKIQDIKKNQQLLFFVIACCFIETMIFNYIFLNNYILLIMLLLTNWLIVTYIKREFNLIYFIIPSILIALLLTSNIIALMCVSIVFSVRPIDIGQTNITIIVLSIVSRVIYLILCCLFYYFDMKFMLKNEVALKKGYWGTFCVFTLSFLGVYTTLFEAIFYNLIKMKLIYRILFEFIIMMVSFFILYFNIQKEYHNQIHIYNQLMKSYYTEETYKNLNKLSYQILNDKHRMFYILLSIKNLAIKDNNDDIIKFINKEIINFKQYNLSEMSGNLIFDYYILNKIQLLKQQGYDIKLVITVEDNNFLEDMNIIDEVKEYIDKVSKYSINTKRFEIYIHNNESYVIIKIITDKNIENPIFKIDKSKCVKKVNIVENTYDEIEINLLFKINGK